MVNHCTNYNTIITNKSQLEILVLREPDEEMCEVTAGNIGPLSRDRSVNND